MSNLSSIGRKSQSLPSEHHHWEGACILQLDYNVVLISGKTAFLSIRSEQVLFNKSTNGNLNVFAGIP